MIFIIIIITLVKLCMSFADLFQLLLQNCQQLFCVRRSNFSSDKITNIEANQWCFPQVNGMISFFQQQLKCSQFDVASSSDLQCFRLRRQYNVKHYFQMYPVFSSKCRAYHSFMGNLLSEKKIRSTNALLVSSPSKHYTQYSASTISLLSCSQ